MKLQTARREQPEKVLEQPPSPRGEAGHRSPGQVPTSSTCPWLLEAEEFCVPAGKSVMGFFDLEFVHVCVFLFRTREIQRWCKKKGKS